MSKKREPRPFKAFVPIGVEIAASSGCNRLAGTLRASI